MTDRIVWWLGASLGLVLGLGAIAVAAEWAMDRVVKTCRIYSLVLEFLWDREKYKRKLAEQEGANP